jgi:HK97 family phage major capsid protein
MLTAIRTYKDLYGRYMLEPSPTAQAGMVLFGIPVSTTVHLDNGDGTSSVILMDTEQAIVARDLSPEARIFDQTLARTDEIALRVTTRYDTGSVWPQGIAILTNASHVPA